MATWATVGLLVGACGRVDYRARSADAGDAPGDGDAARCACDQDVYVDPGGVVVINIWDLSEVKSCYLDPGCAAFARADVNCDGVVDECDGDAVADNLFRESDPTYCEREPCGACELPDGSCKHHTRSPCLDDPDGPGTWLGQGSVCP